MKLFAPSVLAIALVVAQAARADAPSEAVKDQARRVFAEGLRAEAAGKATEACRAFRKAWESFEHYQIAGKVAECEMAEHRYRDAAEHLAYALLEPVSQTPPAERAKLQSLLAKAEANVVALRLDVEPRTADVSINGKAIGQAWVDRVLYVDAGVVRVEARLEGYAAGAEELHGVEGSAKTVRIVLVKLDTLLSRAPVATEPVAPRPQSHGTTWWPLALGTSMAIAASSAAAVFFTVSGNRERDATNVFQAHAVVRCPAVGTANEAACASHDVALSDARTFQDLGIGFVLGAMGAVVAGGVAMVLIDLPHGRKSARSKNRRTMDVAPSVAPGGSGFVLRLNLRL